MRWTAAILAGLVGAGQLTLFVVAERQLRTTLAVLGPTPEASPLRWAWVVAWSFPWFVGAVLLASRARRVGVAVVVTSALLLVSTGFAGLRPLLTWPIEAPAGEVAVLVDRYGGAAVWVGALVAGLLAWFARPRGGWRGGAPGPAGWYVALAVFAWMPSAFQTLAFAPPGAPRRFVEADAVVLAGLEQTASFLGAGTTALLLFVAPRLRRDLGGAVLLAFAVPSLFAELSGVVRVATEEFVILTPPGVLGLIGVIGLVVTGVVWMVRGPAGTRTDAQWRNQGSRPGSSTG